MENDKKTFIFNGRFHFRFYSDDLIRRPLISFRLAGACQDEEKAAYALTNDEMQQIVCFRYVCGRYVTFILIFRMGQG